MNIQLRKTPAKTIPIGNGDEIYDLAKKLSVTLDSKTIRHIIELGMKPFGSEKELEQTLGELEEKKKNLESFFREIALQGLRLESKYVGLRNQIVRISRDNRVLAFHLSTHAPKNKHERQLRDDLIDKYLIQLKLM